MSAFDRLPRWLVDALQLQDPDVPNVLAGRQVSPTIDVIQGGWGLGGGFEFWETREGIRTNQVAGTEVLFAADPELTRLVVAAEINFEGGALGDFLFSMVQSTTVRGHAVFEATAVADQRFTWRDMSAGPYWIVPPGFRLIVQIPVTGVGETVTARVAALEVPVGFKPI